MEKILVSACLLGEPVRYDGASKTLEHPTWLKWQNQGRFIALCPECAGGLSTPRAPAEQQSHGLIMTQSGDDVTAAFAQGAQLALKLVKQYNIKLAVLKARSPSCGNEQIYDGSFQGRLIDGQGLTAKALMDAGVWVFNEHQIELAQVQLEALER